MSSFPVSREKARQTQESMCEIFVSFPSFFSWGKIVHCFFLFGLNQRRHDLNLKYRGKNPFPRGWSLSRCRCGHAANQLKTTLISLASLLSKRSLKFAGKVISRPYLRDEWVKRSPKSSPRKGKSKVRLLRLIKILCLRFLWPGLCYRATSLFDRFTETLIFQYFGECDKYISFVRCSALCKRNMPIEILDESPRRTSTLYWPDDFRIIITPFTVWYWRL